MALTRDHIVAAANELAAAGQPTTLVAVRGKLGGGSYTVISDAMRAWRAERMTKEAPRREPVPEPVVVALQEFGAALWASASAVATAKLTVEREALAAAQQQLEQEKAEAVQLADQLAEELESLKATVAAGSAERDTLAAELAVVNQRATTAEAQALAGGGRIEDLHAEVQRLQAERDADRQRASAELRQVRSELAEERRRQEERFDQLVKTFAMATKGKAGPK